MWGTAHGWVVGIASHRIIPLSRSQLTTVDSVVNSLDRDNFLHKRDI